MGTSHVILEGTQKVLLKCGFNGVPWPSSGQDSELSLPWSGFKGSIPVQGTKIPHAVGRGQKKKSGFKDDLGNKGIFIYF